MESPSIVDEDDARRSSFRRRNNILILVLAVLIISLALTIAALIMSLMRADAGNPKSDKPSVNPALVAFCFVSDAPTCLGSLNPLIRYRFISDPNQIFLLSLQLAAEHLQHTIDSLTDIDNFASSNCSDLLRDGLDQVRDPLETMRVGPFVEWKSDEQRAEMVNRITAAEGDVGRCLDDLGEIGLSDGSGGVSAELVKVRAYLNGAGDFVVGYAEALQMFAADAGANRGVVYDYAAGFCVFGLQVLFVFCLFWWLFGIKTSRKF